MLSAHAQQASSPLLYPDEKHFKNIRQLTFGGDNAEAYFGFDNEHIIFQRTKADEGLPCDQIFYGSIKKRCDTPGEFCPTLVSTGKGRTTCAYLMPDKKHLLYATTHLAADTCPKAPDRREVKKYVWPIYDAYDIVIADLNGKVTKRLTSTPGYDAEATISPDGRKIVFTSTRNGDLDLYTMNLDGSDVRQITTGLGYDGGAWFSPDSRKIVWRASRPKTDSAIREYKELYAQGLVMPTQMEVFIANADGTDARQITAIGKANWAPNFTPDGKQIIFASNHEYERGFPFNLYLMNLDGSNVRKISHDGGFDAFPAFSPDGKKFIFSSNRNNGGTHATNLFICDWIP
jgi:Tol biopolymer transport system component